MGQQALIGRTVAGRFVIKRFLGEGGMATVYVAEQASEPREVALKIMNEELTSDRTFVLRFQREAKAAARVQHPNSVQIIDYGIADGQSYIAMELLVGDDLYVLLERDGAIHAPRAVRILAEVCDALVVAHELGIVHRDLKPENIMVIADPAYPGGERVKVLDFGIAKLLAQEAIASERLRIARDSSADVPSGVTRAGTFIGTPAYMSPEQCALEPVDTRADLYTCGVLLFQLVTGHLPFEGQTPLHTAMLHIHRPTPAPSSIAPGIDPRLEAVILKALGKKPEDRFQTALELGSALRELLPVLGNVRVGTRDPKSRRPGSVAREAPNGSPSPPTDTSFTKTLVGAGGEASPPMLTGASSSTDEDRFDNLKTLVRVPAGASAIEPPATLQTPGPRMDRMPPPAYSHPTFGTPSDTPQPFGSSAPSPTARSESLRQHEPRTDRPSVPYSGASYGAPTAMGSRAASMHGAEGATVAMGLHAAGYAGTSAWGDANMASPLVGQRSPAPRMDLSSVMSGTRGLVIGFVFGAVMVGLLVVSYVIFLRR